jgi:WD40 repeat protein
MTHATQSTHNVSQPPNISLLSPLLNLQNLIDLQQYDEAIRQLLSLLQNLSSLQKPEETYSYLSKLFPYFKSEDFKKFREYFPGLLQLGTEEQKNRAQFELRFWDIQETQENRIFSQFKSWLENPSNLPSLQRMYQYLFQWFPRLTPDYYISLTGSLQKLLNYSSELAQEQMRLCMELADWNLKKVEKEHLFGDCLEAAQYLAKAIQIAEKKGFDSSEAYKKASTLLGQEGIYRGRFKNFRQQINDLKRTDKLKEIKQLLCDIDPLEKFFCRKPLYQEVQEEIGQTQSSSYSCWYDTDLNDKVNNAVARLDPTQTAAHFYRQKFKEIKEGHRTLHATHPTIPSASSILLFQNEIFSLYQDFVRLLITDIFLLLGKPPSRFELHAMGSLGRKEPCAQSDFEIMILYEKQEDKKYFQHLVDLLRIQICLLGETDRDDQIKRLVFTCIHRKNPQGFMLEGNPDEFIGTPQSMAHLQKHNQGDPSTFAHMVLKTTLLFPNDPAPDPAKTSLSAEMQTQMNALLNQDAKRPRYLHGYLKARLEEFRRAWPKPCFPTDLNLKKQFTAPLNYLLADLSLWWEDTIANTLDLVDIFVFREVFTPESSNLIKEALSSIYFLRSRLHLSESDTLDGCLSRPSSNLQEKKPVLTREETSRLEKYFWLILLPFYTAIETFVEKTDHTFESTFRQIDLGWIGNVLDNSFFRNSSTSLLPMIPYLVAYLLEIQAPQEAHLRNFKRLSFQPELEPLRKAYLDALEKNKATQILEVLHDIPNAAGFRYSFSLKSHHLQTSLLLLLSSSRHADKNLPQVQVTAPSFGGYLKPEAIEALITKGEIRPQYQGCAHKVCDYKNLHFKQKPVQPLMEYAVHNLMYRIAGPLTPTTELVQFEVTLGSKKEIFPVLVSETILGENLKEKAPSEIKDAKAWQRWTWMILCTPLTKPGDGLASNYIFRGEDIYCIDNDISFVIPFIYEKILLKQVNFCSALFFLYPNRALDAQALIQFCQLEVDEILDAWIGDVLDKEKEYLALFPVEDRKRWFNDPDPKKKFSATALFHEGAIMTLKLQFHRLQNYIRSKRNKAITALELLEQMVLFCDFSKEIEVGSYVAKAYRETLTKTNLSLQQKTSEVRRQRGSSLSLQEAHKVCLNKAPTFEECENLKRWTPVEAQQELQVTLLKRSSHYLAVRNTQNQKVITANFKGLVEEDPDQSTTTPPLREAQQRLVLRALIHFLQMEPQKPTTVALQHCSVLDSETLGPFLHENLEELNLTYCSQIQDKDIETIQQKCPFLKTLNVSGSSQLKNLESSWVFSTSPLDFSREELKILQGHTNTVRALAVLEGGKKLASGSYDNTIRVWDVETGREVKKLEGHSGLVTIFAVLEGGKKLASGSSDGTIRVWDVETGRKVKKLAGHSYAVSALAVLEGGKKLASGSADKTIRVWEVETGRELKKLEGHTNWVDALAVLEGGKKLVSGSADKTIRIWDMETGREVKKFEGHTDWVITLAVLEGGKKLVSGSADKTIRIWDMEMGREVKKLEGHTSGVMTLALLEGGKKLVSGSADKTIQIWNLGGLEHLSIQRCENLKILRLRAHFLTKLVANNNPQLNKVEIETNCFPHMEFENCPQLSLKGVYVPIFLRLLETRMEVNPDIFPVPLSFAVFEILGNYISDEIISQGREEASRKYIDPLFQLVEMSKQDPTLATTAANAITILNFAHVSFAGRDLREVRIPGANLGRACLKKADLRDADLKSVRLSEAELDHCQLAGANMQHVEMRPEVIWCKSSVNCLITDGTGKRGIAAVGNDISIVDMETRREVKKLEGHTGSVTALALLKGGKKLASGSADKTIRVWDMETGREVKKLEGHTDLVSTLAVLEGGKKLASGSADSILVWEVETGKEVKKLEGHTSSVITLAVLEGGKRLASGSYDNTIRVWEVETGRELFAISKISSIRSLAFKEPDLLYAGDESGGLTCWRLNFKTPEQSFTLLWTHRPTLSCQGVEIKDIQNLSELNQRIMLDHGAKLARGLDKHS